MSENNFVLMMLWLLLVITLSGCAMLFKEQGIVSLVCCALILFSIAPFCAYFLILGHMCGL